MQLALSFFLFALTSLIVLIYPLGRTVDILRHGLRTAQFAGHSVFAALVVSGRTETPRRGRFTLWINRRVAPNELAAGAT